MLRSSRAGRKEAARFHMAGPSRNRAGSAAEKLSQKELASWPAKGRVASASKQAAPLHPSAVASSSAPRSRVASAASRAVHAGALDDASRPHSEKQRQSKDRAMDRGAPGKATASTQMPSSTNGDANQSGGSRDAMSAALSQSLDRLRPEQWTSAEQLVRSYDASNSISSDEGTRSGQSSPPTTHSVDHNSLDASDEEKEGQSAQVAERRPGGPRQAANLQVSSVSDQSPDRLKSNQQNLLEQDYEDLTSTSATEDDEYTASELLTPNRSTMSTRDTSTGQYSHRAGESSGAVSPEVNGDDTATDLPSYSRDVISISSGSAYTHSITSTPDKVGNSSRVSIRSQYRPHQPREIPEGNSLVLTRTPRSGRKSLKQIEAEESGSTSQPRRRRSKHSSEAHLTASPSVPLTSPPKGNKPRRSGALPSFDVNAKSNSSSPRTTSETLMPASVAAVDRVVGDDIQSLQRRLSRRTSEVSRKSTAPTTSIDVGDEAGPSNVPVKRRVSRTVGAPRPSLLARTLGKRSTMTTSADSEYTQTNHLRSAEGESSVDTEIGRDDLTSRAADGAASRMLVRASKQPSWKKKVFLDSGLYSDDFKMDNDSQEAPQGRRSVHDRATSKSKGPLLPLPTDFGYWKLVEKRDFRLPFPLSQEIEDVRAKLATRRKPQPYKHISTNRYVSRAKLPGEIMICQCPPSGNCGDSCVNRQTEYLCHPKHCPCGDNCTNIQFGKRKPIKTEVKYYGSRGFGLRTLEAIPRDNFIDEYRGEVISYNEMVRRVRDHYKAQGNYYFLMYDAPAGEMLDGGLKGNITRFANHSCDPNCKIQKWLVCGTDEARAGEFQVALFAARDIAAGEELTYDYGWSAFSPKSVAEDGSTMTAEACHCGADNCSGFMGVKKAAVLPKPTERAPEKMTSTKRKRRARKIAATQEAATAAVLAAGREARAPSTATFTETNSTPDATTAEDAAAPSSRAAAAAAAPPPSLQEVIKAPKANTPRHSTPRQQTTGTSSSVASPMLQTPKGAKQPVVAQPASASRTSATKRIPVKDRTTYEWTTAEPINLIDSQRVPMVTGKRQRNAIDPRWLIEDSPAASESSQSPEAPVKRRRVTMDAVEAQSSTSEAKNQNKAPTESNRKRFLIGASLPNGKSYLDLLAPASTSSTPQASSSAVPAGASNLLAGDEDVPFDFSKHPPGTKFYTRAGQVFDFSRLLEKRRGQRPRVYTAEELLFAQNRHRASVAKANRVRRAKLKARATM